MQYLKKIRGNSSSTITHYLSALDVISSYLIQKQKIRITIYEITDLNNLQIIKEDLYQDPVFVDKDERGHRMYSAGLNNYCRFASGENFASIQDRIPLMDITVPRNEQTLHTIEEFKRSTILKIKQLNPPDTYAKLIHSIRLLFQQILITPLWRGIMPYL